MSGKVSRRRRRRREASGRLRWRQAVRLLRLRCHSLLLLLEVLQVRHLLHLARHVLQLLSHPLLLLLLLEREAVLRRGRLPHRAARRRMVARRHPARTGGVRREGEARCRRAKHAAG